MQMHFHQPKEVRQERKTQNYLKVNVFRYTLDHLRLTADQIFNDITILGFTVITQQVG